MRSAGLASRASPRCALPNAGAEEGLLAGGDGLIELGNFHRRAVDDGNNLL